MFSESALREQVRAQERCVNLVEELGSLQGISVWGGGWRAATTAKGASWLWWGCWLLHGLCSHLAFPLLACLLISL